ncbi:MAG: acyl-CoA dehydrogenase family protein [Rubrobacter sp.]|nr:acyl-CoA dehydrogenase family protein [Rubrobacter sp.]
MQTTQSPLSSEAVELRDATKEFVEREVEPRAREIEDEDRIPRELIERAKEIGLFAMSVPEEYGGLGLTMNEKAAVYEELGKTSNAFTTVIR